MVTRSICFVPFLVAPFLFAGACGGSDDGSTPAPSTGSAGSAGVAGSGGSSASPGGAAGTTSHAGASGASGHAGGSSGAAGVGGGSGSGGSKAGSGGASAGHAGSAGAEAGSGGSKAGSGGAEAGSGGSKAGSGGASAGHAGSAGAEAGSAGSSGASAGAAGSGTCKGDGDCTAPSPSSFTPPGCAVAKCDTTSGKCALDAVDKDGDGYPTSMCQGPLGSPVVVGTDCDDSNPNVHPMAWDGPMDSTHPNHCDGIDEDCDGMIDDGVLPDGTTCTCAPGDVATCKDDSSGKPISYPPGPLTGQCKYGAQTCLANGTFGPCTGAQGPTPEVCDGLDNDCNGMIDDNPTDAVLWVYDGDDDGHGAAGCDEVSSCAQTNPDQMPTNCPAGGDPVGTCSTCTAMSWKLATAIPDDDCDDDDPAIHPNATEVCDGKDNNCNMQVDEGFNLGTTCDINGTHVGACLGGGTYACAPDLSAKCFAPAGVTIPGDFSDTAAPNGSFDWNCDGSSTHEYTATVCHSPDQSTCDNNLKNECLGLTPPNCGGTFPNGSYISYFQSQTMSQDDCGDEVRVVQCADQSPTCNEKGSPMWVVDRCK